MPDICLNLLTKQNFCLGSSPLEKLWPLDNWLNNLKRVCGINLIFENATRQHFILYFDTGRAEPDRVEVERIRMSEKIKVVHLVPPAYLLALSGEWWIEASHPGILFVSRRILIEEALYTPEIAREMFKLLRENLTILMGEKICPQK